MDMDKESLEYSKGVLDEIEAAVSKLGGQLARIDPEQSGGIPTAVIGTFQSPDGQKWNIVCSVLPTHYGELSTTFVQLHVQLGDPVGEHKAALAELSRLCNAGFLLGSLFILEGYLCMKYVMALDPNEALPVEHFQSMLTVFVRQAGALARVADRVRGGMNPQQAMSEPLGRE